MDNSSGASHADGQTLRGFDIAMIIIPTIFIVLRFWSRALPRKSNQARRFWWDDWAILIALPFNIAACSLQIYVVDLGMGQHKANLTPAALTKLHKVLWASYFMSDLGIMIPKASVLFFYARIFTTQSRWFRYGLWLAHILNVAWWLSAIARCLLFCDPVNKYWDGAAVDGFCRSADSLYIGSAVPSVVIDFFVLLLPMPIIARLSMKNSRKAMITGLFVCGYLVIAISLGRLIISLKTGNALDEDLTYYGVGLIIFVAAEPAVSIIGCCLPVIFYLFQQIYLYGFSTVFGSRLGSSNRRNNNKNSSSGSTSGNRGWARPVMKMGGGGGGAGGKNQLDTDGYDRQESTTHSLEDMMKKPDDDHNNSDHHHHHHENGIGGGEGPYDDDGDDDVHHEYNNPDTKESGLYDGGGAATVPKQPPVAAVMNGHQDGNLNVRSNRDNYERALAGHHV